MTWIDGVALAVIVLSAAFSMVRGFVREILAIFAWVGAVIAALNLFPVVQPYVDSILPLKNLVVAMSIGVIFIVTLVLLSIIAALLGGLVRDSALSGLDRTLGMVFGAARGIVLICLAYIGLSVGVAEPEWPAPVVNARFLPAAYNGAVALVALVPAPYKPKVDPLPAAAAPSAGALMQQPVAGSALRTE
jgi:membrane protein required for colicin V production